MDRAVAASASDSGYVSLWSTESQRMLHTFSSSGIGMVAIHTAHGATVNTQSV